MIPQALVEAYRATSYVIKLPDETIQFRVGQRVPQIDRLLSRFGQAEWVFMTAFNPYSKMLLPQENERRQALLIEILLTTGFDFFRGEGIGDSGAWPAEPALFIPGLPRKKGIALGRVFDQYAIIVGRYGCEPEFVYC